MLPGGHRAIGALAVLMVVLVGAAVLLPLVVSGQTRQVRGVVKVCGPSGFVPIPTVTLTDANGINPPRTTSGDTGGAYQFINPPAGSYSVSATALGFFPSQQSSPVRFDGTTDVTMPDICQVRHGAPPKVLTVTVTGLGGGPVEGASASAYSTLPGRLEFVTSGTTNRTGVVNLTLWPGAFRVRASHPSHQTNEVTVDVAVVSSVSIPLAVSVELFGRVRDATNGSFLSSGVVAWLYNAALANTSEFKMIRATVKGSLFEFEDPRVDPGGYTIIVDAKGYLAHRGTVTFPGTPADYGNVDLTPAAERYDTTVLFGIQDWNNLTVWRNLTLNADSTLPGLLPADLRNLRLQIDATFGPPNGNVDLSDISAFQSWLEAKGPAYVTTDQLFTTNSMAYNSSASFFVSIEGLAPGPPTSGPVWINASATYALKKPPPYIVPGAKTYFLNMTLVADANVTTHQNYTYTFALPRLPRTYEHNVTTFSPSGSAILTGFNRFTVDPTVSGAATIDVGMTVSTVATGIVRAAVVAPTGKFHVLNATFTNYSALLAKGTEFTFSAADSSDTTGGDVGQNNFTWDFKAGAGSTRWNVTTKFTYTVNGTFLVNITMREGDGSNVTHRNITLTVDDTPPNASIRTNRTGGGSANGLTLRVDEGVPVRFDGGLSTDLAFPPSTRGAILSTGYAWDFGEDALRDTDATGRNVTHPFDKPGSFTVNLTVTDGVGLKSTNATMTVLVNDTTAPVIAFDILDPNADWETITSPLEQKTIALDASRTTDEFDADAKLNFTWAIPGPILVGGVQGLNRTLYGINVTFAWTEFNQSYAVRLQVNDTGHRPGAPPKQNFANFTRNVQVNIDPDLHPDLRIDSGTLKVSPEDPEEGALVTVSVNVTNKATRTTPQTVASDVRAELSVTTGTTTTGVPAEVRWFRGDQELTESDQTIPTGTTVTIVLTARLTGVGNKTLRVSVCDANEPWTWCTSENRAQRAVNVRQPFWQPWAILGAIAGLIILVIFGAYTRRKIKAGEWRPIRGRRGERAAEEKPRREVKEEKKRL